MIDALRNEYSVVILLHVYSLVWPVPATHIPGRLPSPSSPFGFTSNTSQSGSFVTQMWHYDFQELYLLALFFFLLMKVSFVRVTTSPLGLPLALEASRPP